MNDAAKRLRALLETVDPNKRHVWTQDRLADIRGALDALLAGHAETLSTARDAALDEAKHELTDGATPFTSMSAQHVAARLSALQSAPAQVVSKADISEALRDVGQQAASSRFDNRWKRAVASGIDLVARRLGVDLDATGEAPALLAPCRCQGRHSRCGDCGGTGYCPAAPEAP